MSKSRFLRLALTVLVLLGLFPVTFSVMLGDVAPALATPSNEVVFGVGGQNRWSAVDTSADGNVAVAGFDFPVAGGKLRRTTNRGTGWLTLSASPTLRYTSVSTSSDGAIIVAAGFDGSGSSVVRSTDAGLTWTTLLQHATDVFPHVAISASGQKVLVAGGPAGATSLLVSTDGGSTFTTTGVAENWTSVEVSGDGNVLYATGARQIWRSIDNGTNWNPLAAAGFHIFASVTTSNDGAVVMGVVSYEQPTTAVLYSRDGGATFSSAAGVGTTFANQAATGAVSGDGMTMIATSYGTLPQVSSDGGNTWSAASFSAGGFLRFALSNDGSVIHGAIEGAGVATSRPLPAPTIAGFDRSTVSASGGQLLIVVGTSFVNVQSVTYGGQAILDFNVNTTYISFTTPPVSGSSVNVVVTTAAGTASRSLAVYVPQAPVVSTVSPSRGEWSGNDVVEITGAHFDDVTRVLFGGVPADVVAVVGNRLTVLTPPNRVGLADIVIESPEGTTVVRDGFRYDWSQTSVLGPWTAVGSDETNFDAITALAVGPNGWLYVGGEFQNFRGIPEADAVAAWDGTRWMALGSDGLGNGAIRSDGEVLDLHFDGAGNLYVGGYVGLRGSTATGVLRWDGSSWTELGTGVDGLVASMATDSSDNLVVAGDFQHAGGVSAEAMARWNGTSWSAVSSFDLDYVWGVAVDGNDIIISSESENIGGIAEADYVARWDGSQWHALGSDGAGDGFIDEVSYSLRVEGSGAGRRVLVGPCDGGVVEFASGRWSPVSADVTFGCVTDMTRLSDGRLVVVGNFASSNNGEIRGIALLDNGHWIPGGVFDDVFRVIEYGGPGRIVITSLNNILGTIGYIAQNAGIASFEGSFPTEMSSRQGLVSGGTEVTIRGTGFNSETYVVFGDRPATSVTIVSSTELRAVAPAHTATSVVVSVYDQKRFVSLSLPFDYVAPPVALLPATGANSTDTNVIMVLSFVAILSGTVMLRRRSVHYSSKRRPPSMLG